MPVVEALASALPPHRVEQARLREVARAVFEAGAPELLPLLRVFDTCGVQSRHFVEPLEWYLAPRGWRERSEAFLRHGLALATEASRRALDRAGLAPAEIDAILLVSTTGIATPSLDARLAVAMGFSPGVVRLPLWGLGCAGGVAGLARAADFASARPESRVLLVCVETCSLAFRARDLSRKGLVAASLFGDGAAAVVVAGDGTGAPGPRIAATASHLFPGTEDVMGWSVEDDGLGVVLSPEIPSLVRGRVGDALATFLKGRLGGRPPGRYLLHPGGAGVIAAFEAALALPPAALDDTRAVLREVGNVSSPTSLLVAQRSLERQPFATGESGLLAALGPGFAAELVLLEGT